MSQHVFWVADVDLVCIRVTPSLIGLVLTVQEHSGLLLYCVFPLARKRQKDTRSRVLDVALVEGPGQTHQQVLLLFIALPACCYRFWMNLDDNGNNNGNGNLDQRHGENEEMF